MASIGTLGKPYRVVYTAKGFVTGLNQIKIRVIKPDLVISELFPMAEFTEEGLTGCYYYDFNTTKEDSLGDYIVIINNPEQAHKTSLRITYQSETQSVALDSISGGLKKHYFGG